MTEIDKPLTVRRMVSFSEALRKLGPTARGG